MCKISITYMHRKSCTPAGQQTFVGKDLIEAMVLAGNYESAHPEVVDTSILVKNVYS